LGRYAAILVLLLAGCRKSAPSYSPAEAIKTFQLEIHRPEPGLLEDILAPGKNIAQGYSARTSSRCA
jgi:hypothetical protein